MNMTMQPLIEAHDITRDFPTGESISHVLRGITIAMMPGEIVVLQGRSGAGKSTLIQILAGLDEPTTGQVRIMGTPLTSMNEASRARIRRTTLGLLFQQAYLFPYLSAQENVEIALRLHLMPISTRKVATQQALEQVGLSHRAQNRAYELSGGEQLRVALARAIVHKPALLLADEPTAQLDTATSQQMLDMLSTLTHSQKMGMLIVTHDANVTSIADRVLRLQDGQISESIH